MKRTREDYARLFESSAGPVDTAALPDGADFVDEFGHRRVTDGMMLAWMKRRATGVREPVAVPEDAPAMPDIFFWTALADPSETHVMTARCVLGDTTHIGELIRANRTMSLEVATEAQLCSLHALAWIALVNPPLAEYVVRSTLWLMDEVQPDNATNLPWAIHAFAEVACRDHPRAGEAALYAETLLHNCRVTLGHPDRRSALILLDAAAWLRGGGLSSAQP